MIKTSRRRQNDIANKIMADPSYQPSDYEIPYINAGDNEEKLYELGKDYDDDEHYDENGNEISTYNEDAKWDWYSIGGRWSGEICGGDDYCLVKDMNMNPDQEEYDKACHFWDVYVDESIPASKDDDFDHVLYKKEYYTAKYGTKEQYAKSVSTNFTYALLVDGNWYEPGAMGWFGCDDSTSESREEYHAKFMEIISDPKYQDYYFVLVDCHI